jgi:crotonobetainyl-CoA:carnitine CoA-transferase CaiB-like acyl-CoA transferase
MAVMMLGDLEAEVVKVEPPDGDRRADRAGYLAFNRNKQILKLDLGTEAGLAALRGLLVGADVAVFDQAPGELERLGLDGPALSAEHPGLVHAWMPPYGTDGRWSGLSAHHSLLAGLTGAAFRQGAYADQPVHLVIPAQWYAQATLGAAAIGAALLERARSGRGQAVTVSGLHGAALATGVGGPLALEAVPRGIPPGGNPRYRLYECADGQWFFLGTLFNNFYRRLYRAFDMEDAFEAFEIDQVAALEMLTNVFAGKPRAEWLEMLRAAEVPVAPVGSREAWFASEAVAANGLRRTLTHPSLGPVAMPGPSARFSATPASIRSLPTPIAEPPRWTPQQAPSGASSGSPLAGVKVLNLGTVIAGAYSGAILANLGADVIKVEPPEADSFRADNQPFMVFNRGVRGLGLDLKQPAGREAFLQLAAKADVVIDNYRLGVRRRLGIDYPALKAVNPRLISCSITAYGDTGPRAALPGFDPLMQAEGGMMAAQGGTDAPVLYTMAVSDIGTAGVVAASVVAALNARERTGEGQEIATSLLAQSLLFQLDELVDHAGRRPNDRGATDCIGLSAVHRYYACAGERWIGVACASAAEAAALGRALGVEMPAGAMAEPPRGAVADRLAEALADRPREAVLDALLAAGVAAAPAIRGGEVLDDGWLWENRYHERWVHPRLGPAVSARAYADFARTPAGFVRPPPELGQHSAEILREYGLDPARIAALLASGAVFETKRAVAAG